MKVRAIVSFKAGFYGTPNATPGNKLFMIAPNTSRYNPETFANERVKSTLGTRTLQSRCHEQILCPRYHLGACFKRQVIAVLLTYTPKTLPNS